MTTRPVSTTGEMATVTGERTLKERGNLFEIASQQAQMEKGAKAINLDPAVEAILSQPKNEIICNFPVRMDNGELKLISFLVSTALYISTGMETRDRRRCPFQ